jgi:TM2 domain-containing membrane protein YozV
LTNAFSTPPGWYLDPAGSGQQRFYDGADWTPSYLPTPTAEAALSTKNSAAAGLLQLFFGWFGLGRFYIGSIPIAVTQLCLGLLGIVFTAVTFGLGFFFTLLPLSIWTFIDAIVLFTGNVQDGEGRKLR